MTLIVKKPPKHPESGATTSAIRPITDGSDVTVIKEPDKSYGDVFFSLLDDVRTTVSSGVAEYARNRVRRELNNTVKGPESIVDSTGNVDDRAGNVKTPATGFVARYKNELIIGGAVLSAIALVLLMRR